MDLSIDTFAPADSPDTKTAATIDEALATAMIAMAHYGADLHEIAIIAKHAAWVLEGVKADHREQKEQLQEADL